MRKQLLICLVFLSIIPEGLAQISNGNGNGNGNGKLQLINPISLNGEVNLTTSYRDQRRRLSSEYDHSNHFFLFGGVKLKSRTAIWHPNFLRLDLDAEFNPATSRETYIVIPDRSEVLTSTNLEGRLAFFSNKAMNVSALGGYNSSLINREYITSVRRIIKYGGVNFNYRNKVLPFSIMYNIRESDHEETNTQRKYKNSNSDFRISAFKSFSGRDRSEINYLQTNYLQRNWELSSFENSSVNFNAKNTLLLDSRKNYIIKSAFNHTNLEGSLNLSRLLVREEVSFKLPKEFRLSGNYVFSKTEQDSRAFEQNSFLGKLEHQLYKSLHTAAYGQYSRNMQDLRTETQKIGGVEIRYNKKVPLGILNITYSYRRQHLEGKSDQTQVQILDESKILTDGVVSLLDNPFVLLNSVVVKDANGIIIYQPNFDYLLIIRGDFVEIQRIPGGQIPDNTQVLIDYISLQPSNYQYNGNQNTFSASTILFDRKVEIYYSRAWQRFSNVELIKFLTLDNYDRNIAGIKIHLWSFNGGAEFEDFDSELVPIRKARFFLDWTGNIRSKFFLNINGDISDYHFTEIGADQLYMNLSSNLNYFINPKNKLGANISIRRQQGDTFDLDIFSVKAEYETNYRLFQLSAGVEFYDRDYVNLYQRFWGVYLKLRRVFEFY